MAELWVHNEGEQSGSPVRRGHPLPVEIESRYPSPTPFASQTGLTVDNTATGVALTVPAGAQKALVQVYTAPIRFWVSGRIPTTSTGFRYDALGMFELESPQEMKQFRAIRETSISATLEGEYYG